MLSEFVFCMADFQCHNCQLFVKSYRISMLLKTYFVYYSFKRVPTLTKWIPYYAMVMDKYPLGSGYQESDVKQNISDAMLHLLIMWSLWQCFIFFSFEHLHTLIRHWYNCKQNKCWCCLTDDTRLLCWHYYGIIIFLLFTSRVKRCLKR